MDRFMHVDIRPEGPGPGGLDELAAIGLTAAVCAIGFVGFTHWLQFYAP